MEGNKMWSRWWYYPNLPKQKIITKMTRCDVMSRWYCWWFMVTKDDDDNDDGNDDEIMMVDSRLGGGSVMNVTLVQTWKSKRNWVRFWFNFLVQKTNLAKYLPFIQLCLLLFAVLGVKKSKPKKTAKFATFSPTIALLFFIRLCPLLFAFPFYLQTPQKQPSLILFPTFALLLFYPRQSG